MKEEEIKLLEQFLKILGFERKEDTSIWKLNTEYKIEKEDNTEHKWSNIVTVDMDDLTTYTLNDATLNLITKKQSAENSLEFNIRNELMYPQDNGAVVDEFISDYIAGNGGRCPTCQQ